MLGNIDDFTKTLKFSHFTIENLHDSILWIDEKGRIIRGNQSACDLYACTKEEILQLHLWELLSAIKEDEWPTHWKNLAQSKKLMYESDFFITEGTSFKVEVIENYLEFEKEGYGCCFIRDISRLKSSETLLRKITKGTANKIGEDYFISLVKNITQTIGSQYVAVTECLTPDRTRLRTLAYVKSEKILENIEYETKDTPCEIVMEGKDFVCSQDLEKEFPREKGFQFYFGVPIYDSKKEVVGHIAGFDSQPRKLRKHELEILKIFAARAGAEIERKNAEFQLHEALKEIQVLKDKLQAENTYLQEEIKLDHNFDEIITQSKLFRKILSKVEQVASTDATVLILGETGTGKELLARAIHNISKRRDRALVKVNCAALPSTLIESELFGHEKGAFTGALARKIGRFELANEGTLFLDEIGELPLELQSKLLRVLQEGEFERLGSSKTKKVNVRIIAASNRNLEKEVDNNSFRSDLYYRLNVFPIQSPALRTRKEDIPLLVRHFVRKFGQKMGKSIDKIPLAILHKLDAYNWPGNVRELENVIERAVILSPGNTLQLDDWLPPQSLDKIAEGIGKLDDAIRQHICKTLDHCNWKVSGKNGAAQLLGMKPTTLESKIKKLGIIKKK
ncbi:MAG: sigma 54-interacting transcriptional regulator [Marinifilaceae bacterium]